MPVALIRALAELPERVRLSVVGYETAGSIGYIRHLQHLAVELRVGGRLKFLGAFPTRANLLETCSRQDVGIAFMPMKEGSCNERTMAGASNKAFDYLACGVPVLTSDLPDWRSAFVEPGYGLACDSSDPHSIARSLKWFLDHPAERRQMGEKGRQRILADWNYERQFEPVLRMLEGGSE
jgi:glycosyltransferase involved in cell wall biosynthesis